MILIILSIALMIYVVYLLSKPIEPEEPYPYKHCEDCRYINRNCTDDPCIICDCGSEWRKSTLDGQEEFDG